MNAAITHRGQSYRLCSLTADLLDGLQAFFKSLDESDLLFLPADVRRPDRLAQWLELNDRGVMKTLLLLDSDQIVGCVAIERALFGWSTHVGEIRVLVGANTRGCGLGQLLVNQACLVAAEDGVEKLVAHMTLAQGAAKTLFQHSGFKSEAVLTEHVKDSSDNDHDLLIMSRNLVAAYARQSAFGLDNLIEQETSGG